MHIYAVPAPWEAESVLIYAIPILCEAESMHICAVTAPGKHNLYIFTQFPLSRKQNLLNLHSFSARGNRIYAYSSRPW